MEFLCEFFLYIFMRLSYLHLIAKWHLITFKYNEVTDILAIFAR